MVVHRGVYLACHYKYACTGMYSYIPNVEPLCGTMHSHGLTMKRLQVYNLIEVMQIVRINTSKARFGILNLPQIKDVVPYWLARGVPRQDGIL
jgi:hypothetical protein